MVISIIIPVYNVESYIGRCLESVIIQETDDVDIECILIDDCGRDNSMSIVRQIISNYQGAINFHIILHEKNLGLSAARNTGLLSSVGDYVMFIDSDDYLMPCSISYFIENLKLYSNVDMVVGNVNSNSRNFLFHSDVQKPWIIRDLDILIRRMLNQQINICAWNKLIRRDLLLSKNIRFVEGIIFEDMTWSYALFSQLSSVLLLPKVTYVYEDNPDSITYTASSHDKVNKALWSYNVSCNLLLDTPPHSKRYRGDITVDYLLFIDNIMMRASDLPFIYCDKETVHQFYVTRRRLMMRTLAKGRFLISIFFLFLYSPFCNMKRFKWFRHHHKAMEHIMGHICHSLDFLHRR